MVAAVANGADKRKQTLKSGRVRQQMSVHRAYTCEYMQREEANLVHLKTWATNECARTLQKFNSDLVCQQTLKICLSLHTHPQLLYIV